MTRIYLEDPLFRDGLPPALTPVARMLYDWMSANVPGDYQIYSELTFGPALFRLLRLNEKPSPNGAISVAVISVDGCTVRVSFGGKLRLVDITSSEAFERTMREACE